MIPYEPDPLRDEDVVRALRQANHMVLEQEVLAGYQEVLGRVIEGRDTAISVSDQQISVRDGFTRDKSAGHDLRVAGFMGNRTLWGRPRTWSIALGVLASVAIPLVGIGVLSHRRGASTSLTTYTTRNGQRADITLADGSTVFLNVGSQLDVPADYASGNRVLRLRGEALFSVAHQPHAPFSVVAGHTVARVLGTSFVVRYYATDTSTSIAVRDGKVVVQSMSLSASQQADVMSDGRMRVRQADPAMFAFMTGKLALDWMPLRDAIPALERWYNTRIIVTDSAMLVRPMKGVFATGSVEDLSQILAVTLHAHVTRNERILTLTPR